MKIAFFSDNFYPELSGIADSILLTGTELARRGHEIHYFVPSYKNKQYARVGLKKQELKLSDRMYVHRTASLSYPTPTQQGRIMLPNFLRGFGRRQFDIVHTHSFLSAGIDALLFARAQKIPLVGTNHTFVEEFTRYSPIQSQWFSRLLVRYVVWYYNKCATVSMPSKFLMDDMQKKGLSAKAVVVSNPIEEKFFISRSSQERLREDLKFSGFTILHAGRLSAEKGVTTLFDAFILLAKDHPDATLVFVGGGVLRASLEERARQEGIGNRVRFLGPFMGDHKQTLFDLYHASDVFATASTSETQGMSMLQAMAAGIPVIGARAGSLPEYITADRGLLFEAGGVDELAGHLRALADAPGERFSLGSAGKRFAETLSVGQVADTWESVYSKEIKIEKPL